MLWPMSRSTNKTTFNVTVQAADGTERTVTVQARSEQQLLAEAAPHFQKRGEKILRVEKAGVPADEPAAPAGSAPSPLGGEGRGEGSQPTYQQAPQQAPPGGWAQPNIPPHWGGSPPIDHQDLLIELRKNNELLDGLRMDLRGKLATRKGVTVDIGVGIVVGMILIGVLLMIAGPVLFGGGM